MSEKLLCTAPLAFQLDDILKVRAKYRNFERKTLDGLKSSLFLALFDFFLTMSNPKGDKRGCTLTSCHSLNSTEYGYNNGCSGYARDNYSIITFVAADPNNPETLNNRKTMRAYPTPSYPPVPHIQSFFRQPLLVLQQKTQSHLQ